MNKSKKIKEILVQLAFTDQIPQDMNELDEHIFDEVFKFNYKDLEAKAEQHALGHYLSKYPEDMEYNEILKRISTDDLNDETGNTIILIWEPFKNRDPSSIKENIESTKESTLELLKEVFAN